MAKSNILALTKASKKKHQEAMAMARQAIAILLERGQKLTFVAIARQAQLSTTFLYKYPDLVEEIRNAQKKQRNSIVKPYPEVLELQQQIRVKCDRIKALESEQAELLCQLDLLAGNLREMAQSKNSKQQLQATVIMLSQTKTDLEKKLKYALGQLEKAQTYIMNQGWLS